LSVPFPQQALSLSPSESLLSSPLPPTWPSSLSQPPVKEGIALLREFPLAPPLTPEGRISSPVLFEFGGVRWLYSVFTFVSVLTPEPSFVDHPPFDFPPSLMSKVKEPPYDEGPSFRESMISTSFSFLHGKVPSSNPTPAISSSSSISFLQSFFLSPEMATDSSEFF